MPPSRPTESHRIAKLLARAGVASRREIERMIADGRVALNGVALDTAATLVASLDGVTVDGKPVAAAEPTRLFLFHKPAGVLTAERDFSGRPTIYDHLPKDLPRLVPVGRLDLNTEGLLLLTTDGGLKRRLELPSTGVERAYRARAYGQVSQPQLEALIEGVEIEGVRYGPIDANLERRTGANVWIELVLTEGKNREVRRVLEHLGLTVSRLIRTRYGPFVLGDMPAGAIGEVEVRDLAAFEQRLGKGGKAESAINVAPYPGGERAKAGVARRKPSVARLNRPHPSAPSALPPSPGGRGVAGGQRPALSRSGRGPDQPAPGPAAAGGGKGEGDKNAPSPSRPARPPQRKAGWARPKPRPGPSRPRGRR